jgi:hypothetical protein
MTAGSWPNCVQVSLASVPIIAGSFWNYEVVPSTFLQQSSPSPFHPNTYRAPSWDRLLLHQRSNGFDLETQTTFMAGCHLAQHGKPGPENVSILSQDSYRVKSWRLGRGPVFLFFWPCSQ